MSSPTKKPTIVLVPGAWHSPSAFDLVASSFQSYGYPAIQVTTPTVGNLTVPFSADVDAIRSAVITASASGDVVLFMHSYGGVPGCCAVEGLCKGDGPAGIGEGEAEGEGRVIALVFCTSWVLDVGESIISNPIVYASKARTISNDPHEVWAARGGPAHVFYGDLRPEVQERWVGRLQEQDFDTIMKSPVTYAAWKYIPSTFIFCTEDRAIAYETQKGIVERAGREGKIVWTEELQASHSPFLSMPEKVVDAIRRAAGDEI